MEQTLLLSDQGMHKMMVVLAIIILSSSSCSSGEGLGYILLNGMNPMLHAPDKFLGDQRRSYLLPFEVTVVKQDSAVFLPTGMLQVT